MPTYEYACSACEHEWEHEQSIKDEPLKECPKCHEQTARRQISRGGGFILKGGGWYSDLYASSSNKSGESTKTSSSTGDSAPAKTETKSESTTPAPKASDAKGGAAAA